MQLKATLIGLALAAVTACGGGEEEALIEEIESLHALTIEEAEKQVDGEIEALAREAEEALESAGDDEQVIEEIRGVEETRTRAQRIDLEGMRSELESHLARLREAHARDAWSQVFPLAFPLSGSDPVAFLNARKRLARKLLELARERRRAFEEQSADRERASEGDQPSGW